MEDQDRRLLRWLLVAVVVVVGGLYLAGYAFAGDRLPRSTTVAGVDVGGLKPDRAEQVLRDGLEDQLDAPVEVLVGQRTVRWQSEAVGLDVDLPASIAQVPAGRSWSPADMWENLVGGEEYDAVVVTVDGLLSERLTELADQAGRPPVEGAVAFSESGPEPTYPRPGTTIDVPAAVSEIRDAYPSGDAVTVPLVEDQPEVSQNEVSRAMEQFANPAMSAPVTFTHGRGSVELRPEDYAAALSMAAEEGQLVPQVDRKQLLRLVRPATRGVIERAHDASVRIVRGRPQVVPAREGVTVDRDRLADRFLELVAADTGERETELPTTTEEPDLSAEEVRALGIVEQVSEFTTYYPHAEYRNVNIGRAAEIIDGTILEPGELFSLNGVVGERTAANGFTRGFIISDGVFKEDFGGGVSQVATTTFNAAFFAGLEDVEHKPHSFYIDRYPVGREATVAWPDVDLRFRNDTGHGILVQTVHRPSTFASQGALTVRMWSTKTWDISALTSERYAYTSAETRFLSGDDCVPNSGYSGFQVDVTRVFRRHGEQQVERRDRMHTTYTPSDTVVCR